MYCSYCGNEIIGGKFCSTCGSEISTCKNKEIKDTETVLFEIKPQFIKGLYILRSFFCSLLPALFLLPFAMMFISLLSIILIAVIGSATNHTAIFTISIILYFVAWYFIFYITSKKVYDKTFYRFYSNRIEYIDKFFTREYKTVYFNNITEISIKQGIFQQRYNIGTIRIFTPSSNGGASIDMMDIENFDEVKKQISDTVSISR